MNADALRDLFNYHFTINRKIWTECIIPLTQEQYLQPTTYSVGSVRNQLVHMMDIDHIWFQDIGEKPFTGYVDPEQYSDRTKLRAEWDRVEAEMRTYIDGLQDEDLLQTIAIDDANGGTAHFIVWQGLIHVINHGTDHRAQLLALLHTLGAATMPQDYASYFWQTL
jgi:uncharacterized damage-inducible protein DinB